MIYFWTLATLSRKKDQFCSVPLYRRLFIRGGKSGQRRTPHHLTDGPWKHG